MADIWVNRIVQLIEEGGPQPVEWLLSEAGRLVPPGVAWRKREYQRTHAAKRKGLETRESLVTDKAIMVGQRIVARQAINHMVWRGRARYVTLPDGQRGLELIPYEDPALKALRARKMSRRFWDAQAPDERSARMRRIQASQTPEQRSDNVRRSWKTRRANSANS